MEFDGEVPESEEFSAILVVPDQFSKVQHDITEKTTCTAVDVAASTINDMGNLCGLARHITLFLGSHFTLKFHKELNR